MKFIREIVPFIVVVICVLTIKQLIVTPIKVNGSSMNDTLYDGDIMLLDEISYRFSEIKRFDIVVAKYSNEYLIKRVIGLPGETISYKNEELYIDGKYIKEDFDHKITYNFDEVKLGKDEYFIMGDNRTNSLDSRVFGPVNIKNIRGKASVVFFPFDRLGSIK